MTQKHRWSPGRPMIGKTRTVLLCVSIEGAIAERVRALAKVEDRSVSRLVSEVLVQYMHGIEHGASTEDKGHG